MIKLFHHLPSCTIFGGGGGWYLGQSTISYMTSLPLSLYASTKCKAQASKKMSLFLETSKQCWKFSVKYVLNIRSACCKAHYTSLLGSIIHVHGDNTRVIRLQVWYEQFPNILPRTFFSQRQFFSGIGAPTLLAFLEARQSLCRCLYTVQACHLSEQGEDSFMTKANEINLKVTIVESTV